MVLGAESGTSHVLHLSCTAELCSPFFFFLSILGIELGFAQAPPHPTQMVPFLETEYIFSLEFLFSPCKLKPQALAQWRINGREGEAPSVTVCRLWAGISSDYLEL